MSTGREAATATGASTGRVRRLTTPIPFVDLAAQHRALARPIREAITRALEHSTFILGEEVEAFEKEFASFVGARHAIGVSSGLDALTLSLKVLGLGPNDEVILPANAFIATILAVSASGARPVLVDVNPRMYTIDVELAARAVTKRTKALLPVHLFGQAADMGPLKDLARDKGLVIVEDACQAHGAAIDGGRCGALGDAGCFSFYPSKNLGALGDGGMIVTDRQDLADSIRLLRNYGQRRKYDHVVKGGSMRLDALQAAVLRVKLRHLPRWNEARRRHASRYRQGLAGLPVAVPEELPGSTHVFHLFVVRAPRRDDLMKHLEGLGISCGIHYPVPIHLQEAYADLGIPAGTFPVTERLSGEVLSLPIYPEMADSDVDNVCSAVAAFYGPSAVAGG